MMNIKILPLILCFLTLSSSLSAVILELGENPKKSAFQQEFFTPKSKIKNKHPKSKSLFLGLQAGGNLNQGTGNADSHSQGKQASLFSEYSFYRLNQNLKLNLLLNAGYHQRYYSIDPGEIYSDYLCLSLGIKPDYSFTPGFSVFLNTGLEFSRPLTYHFFLNQNEKEYQINMPSWILLSKIGAGLNYTLSDKGTLFLESGLKYSLTPGISKTNLLLSQEVSGTEDITIQKQRQLLFFFEIGWKIGIF
jgi:hypothetical protein